MASTSSNLFHDTGHGENETLSIYKCIFCNKLLDGKSKLLDCLHAICNDCLKKESVKSGLQCKCATVTKPPFIDYPLVSPNASMDKICDNSCNSIATRVCTFCNCFYCKSCSMVHLCTKVHNPDLMLPYPSKKVIVLCTRCSKNSVETYCTDCSVKTCSLCHLKYHRMHGHKELDTLVEETKSSLSEALAELKLITDLEENPAMSVSSILSDGLYVDFDETILEDCAAAIKDVGNITEISSMSFSSLSDTNNIKTSDIETQSNTSQNCINFQSTVLNDHCNTQEEILNTANNISTIYISSDDESVYQELDQCSCCNQLSVNQKLIQCNSCDRKYHQNCHIPTLLENINDINPSQTTWKCTLCQDVKILNRKDINGVFAISETERLIMERILMELYCQNFDSELYRELPNRQVFERYYKKVTSPLSLNDVKNNMESKDSYTCLIKFLKDVKRVFSNGLIYYDPREPEHECAVNLTKYLYKMMNDWIPGLDQKYI